MKRLFLILCLLPLLSIGQKNTVDSILIPANLKLKPIVDSINYIDNKPRFAILNYLEKNKLNPENYYVDSMVHQSGDTLYIQVWDVAGIQTINLYDHGRDSINNLNKTSKRKPLKWPKPVGNPGHCFTAYFDLKNQALIAIEYWQ